MRLLKRRGMACSLKVYNNFFFFLRVGFSAIWRNNTNSFLDFLHGLWGFCQLSHSLKVVERADFDPQSHPSIFHSGLESRQPHFSELLLAVPCPTLLFIRKALPLICLRSEWLFTVVVTNTHKFPQILMLLVHSLLCYANRRKTLTPIASFRGRLVWQIWICFILLLHLGCSLNPCMCSAGSGFFSSCFF